MTKTAVIRGGEFDDHRRRKTAPRRRSLDAGGAPRGRASTLVLASLALTAAVGCNTARMSREIARSATPTAIRATLDTLDQRETQRRITHLMASPELRAAALTLTEQMLDVTLTALAEPERRRRIQALSRSYVLALTRAVVLGGARGVEQDLSPAFTRMLVAAIAGALREALDDRHQRALERAIIGVTNAAVHAATKGMVEGFQHDLSPALRDALTSPENIAAGGALARTIAREAVLGSNEAMTQLQRTQERTGRASFLGSLNHLTERSVSMVNAAVSLAVLAIIALCLWFLRRFVLLRRARQRDQRASEKVDPSALEVPS
ncbi:MAG: hypothetical protein JNK05_37885 [Myxococcales bacterium]|nr:hypothetical protein [Myxococcales bacterium]